MAGPARGTTACGPFLRHWQWKRTIHMHPWTEGSVDLGVPDRSTNGYRQFFPGLEEAGLSGD
jgi:hypothetical protein